MPANAPLAAVTIVPRQLLPVIDSRLCTVCGDCVRICPVECLTVARQTEVLLSPQTCINCSICDAICPTRAITMQICDW
ncbi:MAG: 4Fe-4S binding protein [Planctomycetes bacterium]|nr:4Fe-4S binding protein [Planctomycetota bacterium]